MSRVSVIIPSRTERFLVPTVNDVLRHATGDVECIVVLDGYYEHGLPYHDKRLKILHKGTPEGMRPAINHAARMATGDYVLKLDAHCALERGYDEILKADYHEDNWIVVPRRDRLDPLNWCKQEVGKPPVDSHFLSYPYERDATDCGLHGTIWKTRAAERTHILLDEEMSSQGSCWFMSRTHWRRLGELDTARYGNFIQEFQELGLKTWLGGGKVMVNKKTTYLHLHKGKTYGRGYSLSGSRHTEGAAFCTDYWMHDRWSERVHNLRWLIERFSPVPTWPANLDKAFVRRAA